MIEFSLFFWVMPKDSQSGPCNIRSNWYGLKLVGFHHNKLNRDYAGGVTNTKEYNAGFFRVMSG